MDAPNLAIAIFFLIVTFVGVATLVGTLRDLARISRDLQRAEDEAKADDDHTQVIDLTAWKRRAR
jgi:hypothetical protein